MLSVIIESEDSGLAIRASSTQGSTIQRIFTCVCEAQVLKDSRLTMADSVRQKSES